MSRTDRHRPYWVQAADPAEQRWYWYDQGRSFGWRKQMLFRACNCRWCGMGFTRKEENRKRRHEGRRAARDAVKGAEWE